MKIDGKCPHCGKTVQIYEYPANVVFVVDGHACTKCPNCGKTLIYLELIGMRVDGTSE